MLKEMLALIKGMSFVRSKSTSDGNGERMGMRFSSINPKEYAESGQAFKDYLDEPLVKAAERSVLVQQAASKPELALKLDLTEIRGKSNVVPIRQPNQEPPLFDLPNRRALNPDWVKWEMNNSSCNEYEAYLIGALLMMEREFSGPMRQHVTILKRDPAQPMLVSIKYNDPGKPGAKP